MRIAFVLITICFLGVSHSTFAADTKILAAHQNTQEKVIASPLENLQCGLLDLCQHPEKLLPQTEATACEGLEDIPFTDWPPQNADRFVQYLVSKGIELDEPIGEDAPLVMAAFLGNVSMVNALLAHGASASVAGLHQVTAMLAAARNGHTVICRRLHEADRSLILSEDDAGQGPAHYAASHGYDDLLAFMIGVNPGCAEHRNQFGVTPMLLAARFGHLAVCQRLYKHKPALLHARCDEDASIAHYAVKGNSQKVLLWALGIDSSLLRAPDLQGMTPLAWAAFHGAQACLDELLPRAKSAVKKDVTLRNLFFARPLVHEAARGGQLKLVQQLVMPDVTLLQQPDSEGLLPIIHTVNPNHLELLTWMIEKGRKLKIKIDLTVARDKERNTLLHGAADAGHAEMVSYLLRVASHLTTERNMSGFLPIHSAAAASHPKVCELLHAHNPKLTQELVFHRYTSDKQGVLHLAVLGGDPGAAEWIRTTDQNLLSVRDGCGNTAWHWAMFVYTPECVAWLSKHCSDFVKATNNTGQTALHVAAAIGNSACCQDMVKRCPELLTMEDHEGLLPIHTAARWGNYHLVDELYEHHHSLPATKTGLSVLHTVLMGEPEESSETMVRRFRDAYRQQNPPLEILDFLQWLDEYHEEVIDAQDEQERTAFHMAMYHFDDDTVSWLIKHHPKLVPVRDSAGKTALHYAAGVGYPSNCHLLIAADKSLLSTPDNEGRLAVHDAARWHNRHICALLHTYDSTLQSKKATDGSTILHEVLKGLPEDGAIRVYRGKHRARTFLQECDDVALCNWAALHVPQILDVADNAGCKPAILAAKQKRPDLMGIILKALQANQQKDAPTKA